MLIGILSDIHGNYEALLESVRYLRTLGAERILCAGDILGYGASPRECVSLVAETATACVSGNHEAGVISDSAAALFNRVAREACTWTRGRLTSAERSYIGSLPIEWKDQELRIMLVHAELFLPSLFDYVQGLYDAFANLSMLEDGWVCFLGHTHAPIAFLCSPSGLRYSAGDVDLGPRDRAIVNVGSVGQPRDGEWRSSVATYDTTLRAVRIHRLWYDVNLAGQKIRDAGLPEILADRLKLGR